MVWIQKANFPGAPRGYAVAASVNNMGYAGLGWASGVSGGFRDWYQYNPMTDTW
ncbi:MAG: hypothetical protein JSU07_07685, partial [Bacteroidetes bacterium]|nr:hypothetical protein [Bacteroidota bacterium]